MSPAEDHPRCAATIGAPLGSSARACALWAYEPAVGSRPHLCVDLGRVRLRGLCHRRLRSQDPGLAGRFHDGHLHGPRRDRASHLDPPTRRRTRPERRYRSGGAGLTAGGDGGDGGNAGSFFGSAGPAGPAASRSGGAGLTAGGDGGDGGNAGSFFGSAGPAGPAARRSATGSGTSRRRGLRRTRAAAWRSVRRPTRRARRRSATGSGTSRRRGLRRTRAAAWRSVRRPTRRAPTRVRCRLKGRLPVHAQA